MNELIDYYANLIIIQYKSAPRAVATVKALTEEGLINLLPIDVENAYDIETAVGVQLDVLGKYQNVSRVISGTFGIIELGDEDFRTLIKLYILRNTSGSSLFDIKNILAQFFPGAIRVYDHLDMRLTYYVNTEIIQSDEMANAFLAGGLLPFPMGVGGVTIFNDRLDDFFGYQDYVNQDHKNSPYATYDDYHMDWPFMSYRYATEIVIPPPLEGFFLADENLIDNIVQEDGYYIVV